MRLHLPKLRGLPLSYSVVCSKTKIWTGSMEWEFGYRTWDLGRRNWVDIFGRAKLSGILEDPGLVKSRW